jgi:uncharacterized membrane protein
MTPTVAQRAATGVGAATFVLGGALAIAPDRLGPPIGLTDPRGARVAGFADLALVPGLLRGKPRWPWVAARGALNLAIAAYALTISHNDRHARIAATALLGATTADTVVMATLRKAKDR